MLRLIEFVVEDVLVRATDPFPGFIITTGLPTPKFEEIVIGSV
jgi:hypothetical protein